MRKFDGLVGNSFVAQAEEDASVNNSEDKSKQEAA
jgi:hypothetical protein